jgi:tetratricopeptide (TPR) repeat protein
VENLLLAILFIAAVAVIIRKGIPGSLTRQAYSHQDGGKYESAERCFLKALSFEKRMQGLTGQRIGVALQYSNLGFLYHRQRRMDEAIRMFQKAIVIYSDLGRVDDSAPIYASLGKVYFDIGELQLAEESLNKALIIYRSRHHAREAIDTINKLLGAISVLRLRFDHPRGRREGQ